MSDTQSDIAHKERKRDQMKAHVFYDASHVRCYDQNGIDVVELLPGTHNEVKAYKYYMKAGSCLTPELLSESSILYVFDGKGVGILRDEEAVRELDTVCFYAPNYDKMPYTIQAVTDFEFVQFVANMDSHDRGMVAVAALHLPFFRTEVQCDRYDQNCKTPGTISRTVLFGEFDRLGRITCGICQGGDCGGTVEKGHPEVDQWNYALNNSDYQMTVGSGDDAEHYDRKAGDWDYIPAGPDHTLYARAGKEVHYVWIEFNTNKRGK